MGGQRAVGVSVVLFFLVLSALSACMATRNRASRRNAGPNVTTPSPRQRSTSAPVSNHVCLTQIQQAVRSGTMSRQDLVELATLMDLIPDTNDATVPTTTLGLPDPDCYVETQQPVRVGGRCGLLNRFTAYCLAQGTLYVGNTDCSHLISYSRRRQWQRHARPRSSP